MTRAINALQGVNEGEDDVQAGLQLLSAGDRSGKEMPRSYSGDDGTYESE